MLVYIQDDKIRKWKYKDTKPLPGVIPHTNGGTFIYAYVRMYLQIYIIAVVWTRMGPIASHSRMIIRG